MAEYDIGDAKQPCGNAVKIEGVTKVSDTSDIQPGIPPRGGDGEPVAWQVEDLMKLTTVPVFATSVRKHVEGIYSDPAEYRVTPLYARNAAAASDGTALVDALRVAERALEDMCEDDVREGEAVSWFEARALKALPTIRAALAGHPAPTDASAARTADRVDRAGIEAAVRDARARLDAMAPEERDAMWRKQRESWVHAEAAMGESSVVAMGRSAPCDVLQKSREIALKAVADMEGAGPFTEEGRDDDWRFRARLARKETLDAAQAHIALAFDHAALIGYRDPSDVPQEPDWQPMDTAPTDGTHVLLAIKFGPFVYKVQGMYHDRRWHNATDRDGEILCWIKTPMIPDHFLPWTEDYAARHTQNRALKDETAT
ncbi:hypothetical protein [Paracoccus sp. ME4]|uniref:hypothetical protein n=1 Tax=Paracoccus sp. ME4 TaxID=3138066 RepID=UPI00398B5020